jgi:sialate O-acetylesterase
VNNLTVLSNLETIPSGNGIGGNLEFWPSNYGPLNSAKVPGASAQIWDIGDEFVAPGAGYGSMQVHHTTARHTIFAINNWRAGPKADLGIGNSSGDNRTKDWTFANNAAQYDSGRLRVLIRKTTP